jgi:argininosuccinate lyase
MNNQTTRLWGGRFRKPPDPRMMRLSSAASVHARLAPQDIAGGKAHAAELQRAGWPSGRRWGGRSGCTCSPSSASAG